MFLKRVVEKSVCFDAEGLRGTHAQRADVTFVLVLWWRSKEADVLK